MEAPISTTNGAFFTPRFFAALLYRVSNVCSEPWTFGGKFLRFLDLFVQRDGLNQIAQLVNGFVGTRVLPCSYVQRIRPNA